MNDTPVLARLIDASALIGLRSVQQCQRASKSRSMKLSSVGADERDTNTADLFGGEVEPIDAKPYRIKVAKGTADVLATSAA